MTDSIGPKYVYVSGPYSAPTGSDPASSRRSIKENVERADALARELVSHGFIPFVPHTMMRGWEDQAGVSREAAMNVCLSWVERCDAMLVIGMSAGVRLEVDRAKARGIPILDSVASLARVRDHAA